MKSVLAVLLLVIIAGSASAQAIDLGSASIWDGNGGPLLAGQVYLGNVLTVPPGRTLTIQAGVILKFRTNSLYRLDVQGTLKVLGTSGQPVVMTSWREDIGGDTNGDGGASQPGRGNWAGIRLRGGSTDCDIDWCEIRYCVSGIEATGTNSVPLAMRGVSIEETQVYGLALFGADLAMVDSCSFDNGRFAVANARYQDIEKFVNCTASGNSEGDTMRFAHSNANLTMFGTRMWTTANSLGDGVILVEPQTTLHSTASLTLGPGVILKMNTGHEFHVDGEIHCNGTQAAPVIFTSRDDDSAGGDSIGDGPTTGSPGNWNMLRLDTTAANSTLTWTEVRYTSSGASIAAAIPITNCRFAYSAGFGLSPSWSATVTGCSFENNASPLAPIGISALQFHSGNTATGNTNGDVLALGTQTLSGTFTLTGASAFNGTNTYLLAGDVIVGAGGSLTIAPGVIIKGSTSASVARFSVHGDLQVGDATDPMPVVFTSIHDDTWGGDTNADGGATTPAPGDWEGLRFHHSDTSSVENAVVRYAGKGSLGSVWMTQSDMSFRDTTIEHGADEALDADNGDVILTNCAFDFCDTPIVDFDLDNLANLVNCTAQGNAQGDDIRIGNGSVGNSVTVVAANTLNSSGTIIMEAGLSITGTLTLDAGTIVKFATGVSSNIGAGGNLHCNGTAGQPVVITSLSDDAFGGDSGGDGPTTGTPGEWGDIRCWPGHATMTHTRLRYGGGFGKVGLLSGGRVDLTNVVIESSASAGLDAENTPDPVVTNCDFVNSVRPVTRATLTGVPNFTGNTASGHADGDVLNVSIHGSATASTIDISTANTFNAGGVVVFGSSIQVPVPTTIGPGMVLKFPAGAGLNGFGPTNALTVNGAPGSPVVFTSVHDDTYGGADGDPTAPAKGDWIGVDLNAMDAGVTAINGAVIRYAGEGGVASVNLDDADVSLCDVVIELGVGAALNTSFNSAPVLKGVTFTDNCGTEIEGITWAVLGNMTGVQASGNGSSGGYANATTIMSPIVQGNVVIEKDNYFGNCIVVTTSPAPSVAGGNTLSFGRGVVVKCLPGVRMDLSGVAATGYEKTVFTSIKDDSVAGDTNGDGNASTPAPGDWTGLWADRIAPVDPTVVEHALLRYADIGADRFTLVRSSRAEFCDIAGFRVGYNTGFPYNGTGHNLVAWQNNGYGIIGGNIRNCTAVANGTYGITANKAVYCISWNNAIDEYTYSSDLVLGPEGTNVAYSCGTTLSVGPPTGGTMGSPNTNCGAAGWGNIDVDPHFEDEIAGNLRLSANSPVRDYVLVPCPQSILMDTNICKPWGLGGQGYPEDPATTRDFMDGPRPADGDLSGPDPFIADLGAYERRPHELLLLGDFELGAATVLAVAGPPGETGTAIYMIGLSGTDVIVPGWGVLHLDLGSILASETFALPGFYVINVPALPFLAGLAVDIQAIALPIGEPVGSLTEIFRGRFHY